MIRHLSSAVAAILVASFSAAGDIIYVAEEQLTRVSAVTPAGRIQPFANGVGLVYGLALDASGNLYAAGAGDDTIHKITPSGSVSVFASGSVLGSPSGLAFDGFGNLYSTGMGWGGTVNRISPSGIITRVATGIGGYGLACDANNNLYVAGGSSVIKLTPNGTATTFASGFNGAQGVAFDRSGNLYVTSYLGNSVSKISPGGTVSLFASGLNLPTGLAFDSQGNLFVCNITQSSPLGYLSRITPDGTVSTYATGLNYPTAIAILVPEPSALCLSSGSLMLILAIKLRAKSGIPAKSPY